MKAVLAFIIGSLFLVLAGIALDRIREEVETNDKDMVFGIVWYVLLACSYVYTSYIYLVDAHVLGTS